MKFFECHYTYIIFKLDYCGEIFKCTKIEKRV